ncbi:MAG: hypothetical protein R3C61_20100 [Bacteroidia bacterium]
MGKTINILSILGFFLIITCAEPKKSVQTNGAKTEQETRIANFDLEENATLLSFLENPIDLIGFKKKKRESLSSVTNGLDYYFNPKIKDSIYYNYSTFPNDSTWKDIAPVGITVFKFGKNKHIWEDENEILIELYVFGQDVDLGSANLVGLTKTEIESKFGSNNKIIDQTIVYFNKNRILLIEIDNSKVRSFRFVKLNTEKIDENLIRRIK